jgi:hypothetical protein
METWKIALIGGGVILLIVLIAVGIYFLTRKKDTTPAPTTSRSPSGTTTSSPSGPTTSSPSGNNTLPPTTSPSPAPEPSRYYLAKECPTGFRDKGEYGLIIGDTNLFNKGANYWGPWWWHHPRICYGVPTEEQKSKLYTFSKIEKTPRTEVGVIIPKTEVSRRIFKTGSQFNEDWDWSHPFLVTADKVDEDTYYLTKEQSENDIKIGMLLRNSDSYLSDFDLGATLTDGSIWNWSHPFLKPASTPSA